jgi:hypothetical protein
MQSPSFLAHQRHLAQGSGHGRSNCGTLFGMTKIPSDNHIRAMLDGVRPECFYPLFVKAFDALESVKRSVKRYREKGTKGFYAPRVTRGAAVLIDSVVAQIEELFAEGASEAEVAKKLELKLNTLQKAIRAGRVRMPAKKKSPPGRL